MVANISGFLHGITSPPGLRKLQSVFIPFKMTSDDQFFFDYVSISLEFTFFSRNRL